MNRFKNIIFSVLIAMLVSSCSSAPTKKVMWNKIYIDDIYQFLISNDGNNVLFVGIKYDYFFPNNHELKKILLWKDRSLLQVSFEEKFIIDELNNVTGNYSLICQSTNLNYEQTQWLDNNDFTKNLSTDNKVIYIKEANISGTRYPSSEIMNTEAKEYNNLTQPYEITFSESYDSSQSNSPSYSYPHSYSPNTSNNRFQEYVWIVIFSPIILPMLIAEPFNHDK
ncbi:MAG: hypothetical protein COA90_08250 [Gammaproteobacteria bacterium]|nr:MAG: hypothetical protein COA90_08250 [Gammaproteobacteria bacterium]